jgi:hypothetical protein
LKSSSAQATSTDICHARGGDELAQEAITARNSCLSKKLPMISMSRTDAMSRMGQF